MVSSPEDPDEAAALGRSRFAVAVRNPDAVVGMVSGA